MISLHYLVVILCTQLDLFTISIISFTTSGIVGISSEKKQSTIHIIYISAHIICTHANSVIQKVSNRIYQLTRIRSFITKRAALLIYKNMILPVLEYGDIFLHSASQTVRKKLQTLQNKALRCALKKEKLTKSNELHREAKILKLNNRIHLHVLLHMFQLSQFPNFKLWKTNQPTGVRTRSSKKKLISFRPPTNEKFKKSITYQGPKLWNNLPGHLQKLDSYHEFKAQVTKLFNQNTVLSIPAKPKPRPKHKHKPQIKPKAKPKSKTKLKPKPRPKANQKTKKPN